MSYTAVRCIEKLSYTEWLFGIGLVALAPRGTTIWYCGAEFEDSGLSEGHNRKYLDWYNPYGSEQIGHRLALSWSVELRASMQSLPLYW